MQTDIARVSSCTDLRGGLTTRPRTAPYPGQGTTLLGGSTRRASERGTIADESLQRYMDLRPPRHVSMSIERAKSLGNIEFGINKKSYRSDADPCPLLLAPCSFPCRNLVPSPTIVCPMLSRVPGKTFNAEDGMRPLQVTLVRFLEMFHSQEKSGKVERSSLILDLDETALYGNGACLHFPRAIPVSSLRQLSFSRLFPRLQSVNLLPFLFSADGNDLPISMQWMGRPAEEIRQLYRLLVSPYVKGKKSHRHALPSPPLPVLPACSYTRHVPHRSRLW